MVVYKPVFKAVDDKDQAMNKTLKRCYPTLESLVEDGVHLEISGGDFDIRFAGLYQEGQMICQFECNEMSFSSILARLEELVVRYDEQGIATDDINGTEYTLG